MIHPVFAQLATRPGIFVEHAAGYAELAVAELAATRQHWRRKLVLAAAAAAGAAMGLLLAAIAGLLAAALPGEQMPAPWLLVVIPCIPAAASGIAGLLLWRQVDGRLFEVLRDQLARDVELFERAERT